MHKPSSNLSNRRRRRQESGDLADDGRWGQGEVTAEWRSVLGFLTNGGMSTAKNPWLMEHGMI